MSGTRREIELYIDELVLEGFAASDRHTIADALKQELENLLRTSTLATDVDLSSLQLDRLNAGSITVNAGERTNRLGAQLGQALFQSLNHMASPDRAGTSSTKSGEFAQPALSTGSEK